MTNLITMTHETIYNLFIWNRLTTAERLALYNQWLFLADLHGLADVRAWLERARAHDLATQELEVLWKRDGSRGFYHPLVAALDPELDGALTTIHDQAEVMAGGYPEKHPVALAATRILETAFPLGLGAVVNASYVDEAAEAGRVVRALRGDLAADVVTLHMEELVDRLEQVAYEYRAAVDGGRKKLAFAEVQTARLRGLGYVAECAILVLAHFKDSDDPGHIQARDSFLAVIAEYDARARSLRRASLRSGGATPDSDGGDDEADMSGDNAGDKSGDSAAAVDETAAL